MVQEEITEFNTVCNVNETASRACKWYAYLSLTE
jgi:hypothetical protein